MNHLFYNNFTNEKLLLDSIFLYILFEGIYVRYRISTIVHKSKLTYKLK